MSDDLVRRLREEENSFYGTHPCGLLHEAADRIEQLEAALRSISNNTCCDNCREAALVARAALEGKKDE